MEYIDIVDNKGIPVGEVKSRDIVHCEGHLHRHVHVWITNSNGEVLLQKRSKIKKLYPNMWAMSAEGHVPSGSTPEDTVITEIKEELGLEVNPKDIKLEFCYPIGRVKITDDWIDNGINYVYFFKSNIDLKKVTIQKSELSAVKWMDLKKYKKALERKNSTYRKYPQEFPKLFELIS